MEKGRGFAEYYCDDYEMTGVINKSVSQKLKAWAKLQGYNFYSSGRRYLIAVKGIKRESPEICSKCGRRSLKLTRWLWGLGLSVTTTSLAFGVAALCWNNAPSYFIAFVTAIVSWIIIGSFASEYTPDKYCR